MIKDVLKLLLEGEAVRTEAMASVLGVTEAEIEATLAKLEDEKKLLDAAIERARNAILCWIEFDIDTAMNKFNSYSE